MAVAHNCKILCNLPTDFRGSAGAAVSSAPAHHCMLSLTTPQKTHSDSPYLFTEQSTGYEQNNESGRSLRGLNEKYGI
jgi:hypothetical protein